MEAEIGVSSYGFSRRGFGSFEIIDKVKKIGFQKIEFSDLPGFDEAEVESRIEFASQIRRRCEEVGLEVVNYAVNADFLNGDGDLKAEVKRLKREVRVAKKLGAPRMRHDATRGFPPDFAGPRGFEDALPTLVKGCRTVSEFAGELGVETMIENHGFFCQDSERVEKLINSVDHPNFGLLLDVGNFLCVDEEPHRAVGKLAPYAAHVHIKDFHFKKGIAPNPGEGWFETRGGNYLRGAIVGHGEVPIVQLLKLLEGSGYEGTLSVEFEGLEEPERGIGLGRDNLIRYLNRLES